jgi:hypothetical protein
MGDPKNIRVGWRIGGCSRSLRELCGLASCHARHTRPRGSAAADERSEEGACKRSLRAVRWIGWLGHSLMFTLFYKLPVLEDLDGDSLLEKGRSRIGCADEYPVKKAHHVLCGCAFGR